MKLFLLALALAFGAKDSDYVRRAPKGFTPRPADRQVALHLEIRDGQVPKDSEFIWIALEMQNMGRQTVFYYEDPSIFKGCFDSRRISLEFTREDGNKVLHYNRHGDMTVIKWPAGTSEQQKDEAFEKLHSGANALQYFLKPGDTLYSRPRLHRSVNDMAAAAVKGEDPYQPADDKFCGYRHHIFLKPGRYRVRAVLRDEPPGERSAEELADMKKFGTDLDWLEKSDEQRRALALGIVESNVVIFEVAP